MQYLKYNIMFVIIRQRKILQEPRGPSASTGEHCICIVFDLFVVRSCLELFCFLSFIYVICTPVLTEGTEPSGSICTITSD